MPTLYLFLLTNTGRFVVGKDFNNASSSEYSADADESSSASVDNTDDSSGDENNNPHMECDEPALAPIDMLVISRRRPEFGAVEDNSLHAELPPPTPAAGGIRYRDIARVQTLWKEHAASAASMFPKNMWRMLRSVQTQSKVTQENVLKACTSFLTSSERKNWPLSRQKVDDTLTR